MVEPLNRELVAAQDVVRWLTFTDLAFEIRLGFHLGYLRSFAVPGLGVIDCYGWRGPHPRGAAGAGHLVGRGGAAARGR